MQEKEEVKKELYDMLKFDERSSIVYYELDNNNELIEKIMSFLPRILKYDSKVPKSLKSPENTKRPYLSLIRYIFKDDYETLSVDHWINTDNERIKTKKMHFIRKEYINSLRDE